jgi:hypothetical protein
MLGSSHILIVQKQTLVRVGRYGTSSSRNSTKTAFLPIIDNNPYERLIILTYFQ